MTVPTRSVCIFPKMALGLLLLLLQAGCLQEIEIAVPSGRNAIYIEGHIVHGQPSTLQVNVGRLFSFNSSSRRAVSIKHATLTDSHGNDMTIRTVATGRYYYEFQEDDPIQIAPGISYKITIPLTDGPVYESDFTTLYPVPPIEFVQVGVSSAPSLTATLDTRQDTFLHFLVNTNIRPSPKDEKSYLRWEFERLAKVTDNPPLLDRDGDGIVDTIPATTCYIHSRVAPLKTRLYGGPHLNSERLNEYEVLKQLLSRYDLEGQYFTIWQESLSEEAYNYWDKVRLATEEVGDFFGSPPGKIRSNVTNLTNPADEAFGYFYATERDSQRIYIDPYLILGDSTKRACPIPVVLNPDGTCPDKLCCDCLSDDNSTTEKPSFWIE